MSSSNENIIYWLAAIRLSGIGPTKFRRCLNAFPDIKILFSATLSELKQTGLSDKESKAIKNPDWSAAERDLKWCEKNAVSVITLADAVYPQLLKEISDAPLVLYLRGNAKLLLEPQIAIVGSRNPTPLGRELAEEFARSLTAAGLVITSGLALGIDAASHRGALVMTGKTIAVSGTGLQQIYPASHQKLGEEIIEKGVLISEFPPHTPPIAKNFPQRNRIISGLSLGVLVIEAALRSGSLITARFAIEQGRDVFAIPGSIHNPLARGCHALLRQGAKLVETAEDVLEELDALQTVVKDAFLQTKQAAYLDVSCQQLLAHIGYEATAMDVIIIRSGLTAGEVSSMLLALELKGYVHVVLGGYVRTSLQPIK